MCRSWPGTLVARPWRVSVWYIVVLWDFGVRNATLVGIAGSRFWSPCLVPGAGCLVPEGWQHTYEKDTEHFANPNLRMVVVKFCLLGLVVWYRTSEFNLYHNPNLDDQTFDFTVTVKNPASFKNPVSVKIRFSQKSDFLLFTNFKDISKQLLPHRYNWHHSMVWDWRVSRAGSMPSYWPSCSLPFRLILFSLSLLSFYGLVLWGCGIRTDRV